MRQITWLTGDYANVNDRQGQAAKRGCAVTIDFHFNGNGADAKGGEVWYKPGDANARPLGRAIVDAYTALGLPFHGTEPLKEAVQGNRASFIRHYPCPAVLIASLSLSPGQARIRRAGFTMIRTCRASRSGSRTRSRMRPRT